MDDRLPTYPGRVKLSPVSGAENTYDMVRSDAPTQEGTPLNKSTLLADSTALLMELPPSATPNDMMAALGRKVLDLLSEVQPIERGGTGAETLQGALRIQDPPQLPLGVSQGGTGASTSENALKGLGIAFGATDLTPGGDMPSGVNLYFMYK